MSNLIELSKELEFSQYKTDNPKLFERSLAKVFNTLGLSAKHLGGPSDPDILIEFDGKKVTVDAKTSKENSGITEQMIGFSAQKRYKKKYNAYKSVAIGPSFRKGNASITAKEEDIILIETSAICKILYNHNISLYKQEKIFNMLFEGGRIMVTSNDIESSLGEGQKYVAEIIKGLLEMCEKRNEFSIERLQSFLEGRGKEYSEQNIKQSLELLVKLNILKADDQNYGLTRGIQEILADIKILCLATGISGTTEVSGNKNIGSIPPQTRSGSKICIRSYKTYGRRKRLEKR